MLDFVKYIFLFLTICGGIILSLALFNIYTKSYKPNNSIIIIFGIFIIFLINGVLAVDALNRTVTNFGDILNINNTNKVTTSDNLF